MDFDEDKSIFAQTFLPRHLAQILVAHLLQNIGYNFQTVNHQIIEGSTDAPLLSHCCNCLR
jgi:hypothetical protein